MADVDNVTQVQDTKLALVPATDTYTMGGLDVYMGAMVSIGLSLFLSLKKIYLSLAKLALSLFKRAPVCIHAMYH